jgi:hypothetical protein
VATISPIIGLEANTTVKAVAIPVYAIIFLKFKEFSDELPFHVPSGSNPTTLRLDKGGLQFESSNIFRLQQIAGDVPPYAGQWAPLYHFTQIV